MLPLSALSLKAKLIAGAVATFIVLGAVLALYLYVDSLKDEITDLRLQVSVEKEKVSTEKAHSAVVSGNLDNMITLGKAILAQSKQAEQEYKAKLAKATKTSKAIADWKPNTEGGECDVIKELVSDYRNGDFSR